MATIPNDKNWRFPDYTDSPDIPRDISYLAADISEYIDSHPGPQGEQGATGATGPANVLSVGTVTTGNAGTSVIVEITGSSPSQIIDFTIPRGDIGATGPQGEQGPQGETGPQGEQGEQGTGVNILGSYSNLSALQTAHPTGNSGDAYLIDNDLYVWSQSTTSWINVGTIRGPQGIQGIQGIQGEKGDKGDTGETGATGATGATGPQGEQGIQGIQGIQGETGATGPAGADGEDLTSVFTISQKSTSYSIVSSDLGKLIEMSNGGTITVPTDSQLFDIGSTVDIVQTGSSQVTIVGDTGVTVNATPGLKLRSQWSSATLIKRGNNLWVALGDLSA